MKKVLIVLLFLALLLAMPLSVYAKDNVQYQANIYIDDQMDLLTSSQEAKLEAMNIEADFPLSIVIVTVYSLDGKSPAQYANNYYEGLNHAPNGLLFLLSMEERDWYMLTDGEVHDIISDSDCQVIAERFLPQLSSGNYYEAFDQFLTNLPNDLDNSYSFMMLLIAIAIGLIVGLIVLLIMRSQMNTAKPQRSATGYVKDGSYNLNTHLDFFLYSRITKTPRPKSTSSGGGGGGSRGGSGGKF